MRKRRGVVVFLAWLCLGLAACDSAQARTAPPTPLPTATLPPAQYSIIQRHDVPYGPLPGETLDLCQPQGAPGLRPGVVLIHGGGWAAGDKRDFSGECQFFATQGFVAATINYRLAPAAIWPAPLVDAQLAVRALRAFAATLSLDPARLCAWGASAGGHLAVFLGALATIHPGDEAALYANESPQVACVADFFGPTDLTAIGAASPAAKGIVQTLMGGATYQQNPTLYRDASPLFLVSPQTAPTIIIQGAQDTLVPPSQSTALAQALSHAGVASIYVGYPGGHGFAGLTDAQVLAYKLQAYLFVQHQFGLA